MHQSSTLAVQQASTLNLPIDQRFQYWDQFNASHFVGIRCSSYVPEGLAATQQSLHLDDMKLNWIEGNGHVVERDSTLVRAEPKESVLVSLGRVKNAFFHQGSGCEMLDGQYALLYRTDKPYLVGFTDQMRQLTIDIPLERFRQRCAESLDTPLRIDTQDRSVQLLIRTLCRQVSQFMGAPDAEQVEAFQRQTWRLVATMVGQNRISESALRQNHRLMAQQYMDEHLSRSNLSMEDVAHAMGISTRHLSRVFADESQSPKQYLLEQRLLQARELLKQSHHTGFGIADVAYRCGFTSQAYFARVFRQRFEMTATEMRQQSLLPIEAGQLNHS